jgi:splicing factor 3A subunit 1
MATAKDEIKAPPADQFSMGSQGHPVLANIDMDTIKLTAQFVARNGQKFLQGLTERESLNPAFNFLKPTHGLFGYFTTLVEQYSRLLMPRNELLQRYQAFADDRLEIMRAGGERYLF